MRPVYSGGVEEVQMAYQKAKGEISIKKLKAGTMFRSIRDFSKTPHGVFKHMSEKKRFAMGILFSNGKVFENMIWPPDMKVVAIKEIVSE